MNGGVLSLTAAGSLKFGTIEITSSPMTDGLAAIVIGAIAGLLGAFFVNVYSRLGVLRKKFINTNTKKILEVMFFSFITSSLFYWLSALDSTCQAEGVVFDSYYGFTCPQGLYNCQATLFFNTEGAQIRALMNKEVDETVGPLFIFATTWYIMTILTQGIQTPGGLFLPGMIIGCALGLIVSKSAGAIGLLNNPSMG